jgi:hypothetical protein
MTRRPALAPGDLVKADLHCAVITPGLRAHSPAQIDRLKSGTPLQAKPRQGRKDLFVERLTLGLHVLERRANEQPEYRIPLHNSPTPSPAPPMAAAPPKVRPSCFSIIPSLPRALDVQGSWLGQVNAEGVRASKGTQEHDLGRLPTQVKFAVEDVEKFFGAVTQVEYPEADDQVELAVQFAMMPAELLAGSGGLDDIGVPSAM